MRVNYYWNQSCPMYNCILCCRTAFPLQQQWTQEINWCRSLVWLTCSNFYILLMLEFGSNKYVKKAENDYNGRLDTLNAELAASPCMKAVWHFHLSSLESFDCKFVVWVICWLFSDLGLVTLLSLTTRINGCVLSVRVYNKDINPYHNWGLKKSRAPEPEPLLGKV